jgi:nitroreductase
MMIADQSQGLGSCYIGFGSLVKSNAEIVKALDPNENEQINGQILIGYPKNNPTAAVSDALVRICAIKKELKTNWI